jgi:hypothetical protein
MRLKKPFNKQDSITLFFTVCLPPIGYMWAYRKQWVSSTIVFIASAIYCSALYGFIISGYPKSINDIVTLNGLWGLTLTISVLARYLASRSAALVFGALITLLLGILIMTYTPWESVDCILDCKEITIKTLQGIVVLLPGPHLIIFLLSLYTLFGIAVFLSITNDSNK